MVLAVEKFDLMGWSLHRTDFQVLALGHSLQLVRVSVFDGAYKLMANVPAHFIFDTYLFRV